MCPHFVQNVRICPCRGPSVTGLGALILPPQWRQFSPWEIMGESPFLNCRELYQNAIFFQAIFLKPNARSRVFDAKIKMARNISVKNF
jgi:hypothetical protein